MKLAIPSLILLSATLLVADETLATASHVVPETGGYFSTAAGMGTDGLVFDNQKAQVFKAEASGTLDEISLFIRRMTGNDSGSSGESYHRRKSRTLESTCVFLDRSRFGAHRRIWLFRAD